MSTAPKPFVFVLMPFDEKFRDIYHFGIKGAANDVGAYAERIDDQIFSEGILERIFNQIAKADVIVADMTGRNPNVFYEVGYAHALGKTVLLLTQDSNDIPFDLKHKQHTVYGGKIEVLRSDLISKLQWAISESRRQTKNPLIEQYSLRINQVDVPYIPLDRKYDPLSVPLIQGTINGREFNLPLQLRNDSTEGNLVITHVYLFTGKDSIVLPGQERMSFVLSTDWLSYGSEQETKQETKQETRASTLSHFTARPVDAPDGLTNQFRLPIKFSSLPPGAVEEEYVKLLLESKHSNADSIFRLRLHSSTQYLDFVFRLSVTLDEQFEPSKTEGASKP